MGSCRDVLNPSHVLTVTGNPLFSRTLSAGQFTNYDASKDFISDVARLAYDYYIAYAGMVRGITADEVKTAKRHA